MLRILDLRHVLLNRLSLKVESGYPSQTSLNQKNYVTCVNRFLILVMTDILRDLSKRDFI